jgi:glycosyltransferase involved in cell wall biosynthesis
MRGIRVTLVSFGRIPSSSQTSWLDKLPDLAYFPTAFRLEWMQDAAEDISDSTSYLENIIQECPPDLLHLNQYCYGALNVSLPKVVVAHSDVMSWSEVVRGSQPCDHWARWYRAIVEQGLAGAKVVVAPSRWMQDRIESCYGPHASSRVIYNGRTPSLFNPFVSKQNYAASVGRLWDEGKQSRLLLELAVSPLPIRLAGAIESPEDNVNVRSMNGPGIELKEQLSEGEIRELFSHAAIYIATSKYEPFGLAPLEAALSRCAILANDIPSLREVWGDAACYFRSNDAQSMGEALTLLSGDRQLRMTYANRAYQRACQRYTADHMVDEYVQLYTALLERRVWAS